MDLDDFEAFEMEDMSRLAPSMGNPLHIEDDPFSVPIPDFDSIIGSHLTAPMGAPILSQFQGEQNTNLVAPANNKKTIILTCILFIIVILFVIIIIGLSIGTLVLATKINYDVNHFKFQVVVPVSPPPPTIPSTLA